MNGTPGQDRVVAGRYRLLSPLGQGGMGVVWRARDQVLNREVAVKEVRAPATMLGTGEEQRLYSRLEREAWAAARVAHRNVVTVYDVATEDGRPWIVMELVPGLSLADVLDAEGPMDPRRAAGVGAEVLAALRAAHDAGVLHRDVKPGNVLVANDGRVVLTDFGIATIEGSSALTMTGEVIGSPEFLAPERALGRKPGPESDLWSLGVLLYAAVEGHSPFRQDTPLSTLRAVVDEELPPPRRAGPLAPVIEALLRKDPAERITAAEAERLLRTTASGGTPGPGTGTGTTAAVPLVPPVPAAAGSPTATRGFGPPGSGGATPAPASPGPGRARPEDREEVRRRRAARALVAGVAALLLALGGLSWALMNDGDDPGTKSGSSASGGSNGGDDRGEDGGEERGGGTTDDGTAGDGTESSTAPEESTGPASTPTTGKTPPAQTVRVHVTAVRDSYSGACPPPQAEAPHFTGTITVGRVPAQVEYRWVTDSGQVTDPGWKTLELPSGGGKSAQVDHTEGTHVREGTLNDRIWLEVRKPVAANSPAVAFSVNCEPPVSETPTADEGTDY
ncbi:serine/threonine-protein kinase [Streptomyces sp. GC420]|uniref:serine/threonine-protein kinase n=1 Tax=Streptomyces sp. GC420 TaxID=2697568 RepID=UPI001DF41207|nr:serine/threonine-protein kinase [Streptomyces sp. GC420]NBM17202.1 protein kinase [Streptomyces sp. GC420]